MRSDRGPHERGLINGMKCVQRRPSALGHRMCCQTQRMRQCIEAAAIKNPREALDFNRCCGVYAVRRNAICNGDTELVPALTVL